MCSALPRSRVLTDEATGHLCPHGLDVDIPSVRQNDDTQILARKARVFGCISVIAAAMMHQRWRGAISDDPTISVRSIGANAKCLRNHITDDVHWDDRPRIKRTIVCEQ